MGTLGDAVGPPAPIQGLAPRQSHSNHVRAGRRRSWTRVVQIAFLLAVTVAGIPSARAHPHAWIDVRTTVVLDDEKKVTAFEQEWLFDPFYSALATDGGAGRSEQTSEALTALADENLKNLAKHYYFLDVRADDQRLAFGTVTEFSSEMRGPRLWMRFVAPLTRAVDPRSRRVVFRAYDPSYWIEMLYLEGDVVSIRGKGAGRCHAPIVGSTPSLETVALAAALDRGARGADGFGLLFAESVPITCD